MKRRPLLFIIRTAIRSRKITPGFHQRQREAGIRVDKGGAGRGWKVLSIVSGSVQCLSTVIASSRTGTGMLDVRAWCIQRRVIGLSAVMHTHADHLSTGLTFQSGKCKPSHPLAPSPPRLAPSLALVPPSLSLRVDTRSFAYRSLVVLARRTDKFGYGVPIDSAIVIPMAACRCKIKTVELAFARYIFQRELRDDRYSSAAGWSLSNGETRKRPEEGENTRWTCARCDVNITKVQSGLFSTRSSRRGSSARLRLDALVFYARDEQKFFFSVRLSVRESDHPPRPPFLHTGV